MSRRGRRFFRARRLHRRVPPAERDVRRWAGRALWKAVEPGRHRVEFRFVSPAMRTGLLVSGASLLATLGLIGFGWLRGRAAAAPAGPPGSTIPAAAPRPRGA